MRKIIIYERGDSGAPELISMIKALFPECEVEVLFEGKAGMRHGSLWRGCYKESKEEGSR